MLFNSYLFLFGFLPPVLFGYRVLRARGFERAGLAWLLAASLTFYAWPHPPHVALILGSAAFNFALGRGLARGAGRGLLAFGVAANVALLGYFKYLRPEGSPFPLAVSFFTLQQIAWLVDARRRAVVASDFMEYLLFVSFFPQLISGPIVHHDELVPQLRRAPEASDRDLAVGGSIVVVGLAKKVLLADAAAPLVAALFDGHAPGAAHSSALAWAGSTAFVFQIYFDFSAYSDIALGLGRMAGVALPINFNSPLRAPDIAALWRRWHVTLFRFMRDYLFVPLAGRRPSRARAALAALTTFTAGGLWHGGTWTFGLWGAAQGAGVLAFYAWRRAWRGAGRDPARILPGWRFLRVAATFSFFLVTAVLFRAQSLPHAMRVWEAMAGAGRPGADLPAHAAGVLAASAVVVFLLPNAAAWMGDALVRLEVDRDLDAGPAPLGWEPTPVWALALAGLGLVVAYAMPRPLEFIYYRF